MTVQEAMKSLISVLCPHGMSFKPEWLNGNGVDDRVGQERLVLYCLPVSRAIQALDRIVRSNDPRMKLDTEVHGYYWEGYLVVIEKCGPMRLLGEGAEE